MENMWVLLTSTTTTMLKFGTHIMVKFCLEIKEDLILFLISVSQEKKDHQLPTQQERNILLIGTVNNREKRKDFSEVIKDVVLLV
jgi:hypothetical protein